MLIQTIVKRELPSSDKYIRENKTAGKVKINRLSDAESDINKTSHVRVCLRLLCTLACLLQSMLIAESDEYPDRP